MEGSTKEDFPKFLREREKTQRQFYKLPTNVDEDLCMCVFLLSCCAQTLRSDSDLSSNTLNVFISGFIVYNVTQKGAVSDKARCFVQVFDKNDMQVTAYNECAGLLEIGNANFWWPYLMHPEPGYLYTMKVKFFSVLSTSLVFVNRVPNLYLEKRNPYRIGCLSVCS